MAVGESGVDRIGSNDALGSEPVSAENRLARRRELALIIYRSGPNSEVDRVVDAEGRPVPTLTTSNRARMLRIWLSFTLCGLGSASIGAKQRPPEK
jgi:hypothetical protein